MCSTSQERGWEELWGRPNETCSAISATQKIYCLLMKTTKLIRGLCNKFLIARLQQLFYAASCLHSLTFWSHQTSECSRLLNSSLQPGRQFSCFQHIILALFNMHTLWSHLWLVVCFGLLTSLVWRWIRERWRRVFDGALQTKAKGIIYPIESVLRDLQCLLLQSETCWRQKLIKKILNTFCSSTGSGIHVTDSHLKKILNI